VVKRDDWGSAFTVFGTGAGERQVGLEVPLDQLVQRRALGAAPAIHGARALRVDGGVHVTTAVYP